MHSSLVNNVPYIYLVISWGRSIWRSGLGIVRSWLNILRSSVNLSVLIIISISFHFHASIMLYRFFFFVVNKCVGSVSLENWCGYYDKSRKNIWDFSISVLRQWRGRGGRLTHQKICPFMGQVINYSFRKELNKILHTKHCTFGSMDISQRFKVFCG